MAWDNVEDAFKELDKKEFAFIASSLGAFRHALMAEGFTRREALRFVESYSRFIYEMSMEEFLADKEKQKENTNRKPFDDDVDLLDDEE